MAETIKDRTLAFRILIESYSFLLILSIEFAYLHIHANMSKSVDTKTKYATYLLILLLPVFILWIVSFTTREKNIYLGRIFIKYSAGMICLVLLLQEIDVISVLWIPAACFAFGFLLTLRKRKKRKKKRIIYIPDDIDLKEGLESELERRELDRRSFKNKSKARYTRWVSNWWSSARRRK